MNWENDTFLETFGTGGIAERAKTNGETHKRYNRKNGGSTIRFYGKRPASMIHFLVKREDEPTNKAKVEPSSFGLYYAMRRKI